MAQIVTSQIQISPAASVSTELHDDGLLPAFKQQAEQWRKRNNHGDQADADQVAAFAMMPEPMLPAMQLKADTGRVGAGENVFRVVKQQMQALVSVVTRDGVGKPLHGTKSNLDQTVVISKTDRVKSPVSKTVAPVAAAIPVPKIAMPVAAAIPVPKIATPVAAAIPVSKIATPVAVAIPVSKIATPVAAVIPVSKIATPVAAVMPVSKIATPVVAAIPVSKTASTAAIAKPAPKTEPGVVVAIPVPTTETVAVSPQNTVGQASTAVAAELADDKKIARQESGPVAIQNAAVLPSLDMRGGQTAQAQSGERPLHPAAFRQAPQGEVLQGSELTYRFNKWGNGHAVKVQSQAHTDTSQLTLHPSDSLVAHRLGERLLASAPPANWTLLKDGEGRNDRDGRQHPEQPYDEEDAT